MDYISVKKLKKNPSNPRIIKKDQYQKLKESLLSPHGKQFFEARPCIVSNRTGEYIILGGNTRYQAARDLGWAEVPYKLLEGLTEEQEKEIIIRDNVSNGEFDWEILANKWDSKQLTDWGLEHTFQELEPEVEEDNPDLEPPKEPITKRGDIYELGEHRVMCGDSTIIDDVEKLMNGEKADMVFTDPPYGVDEDGDRNKSGRCFAAKNHDFGKIIGDKTTAAAIDFWNYSVSICKNCIFWGANYYCNSLPEQQGWIIWDKRDGVKSDDNADCEIAISTLNKPMRLFSHLWKGMIKASEHGHSRVHPTQKPIALAVWCFSNYGEPSLVLDGFLGSGSTLIACEQTNRKCYGMELDEKYCDVIVRRYIKYCRDNNKEPVVKLNREYLTNLEQYD